MKVKKTLIDYGARAVRTREAEISPEAYLRYCKLAVHGLRAGRVKVAMDSVGIRVYAPGAMSVIVKESGYVG